MEEQTENELNEEIPKIVTSATIEDSTINKTIAALVQTNPLDPKSTTQIDDNSLKLPIDRNRRRSSHLIVDNLMRTNSPIDSHSFRASNFLVGSVEHIPMDLNNDLMTHFTNGRAMTITVATWNTGEAKNIHEHHVIPTDRSGHDAKQQMIEDMQDIIVPHDTQHISDLIVICTQEMKPLTDDVPWQTLLQEVIGPKHLPFYSHNFGTLRLNIFLRRDLIWYCSEPRQETIKFRALNSFKTKASLIVSFSIFGTTLAFLNSHFKADDGESDERAREQNFADTVKKLYEISNDSSSSTPTSIGKKCDCILWAGDMNFRVKMPRDKLNKAINERNFGEILQNDEFLKRKENPESLYAKFDESKINFQPTYKYSMKDVMEYAEKRVPSYTDRILYYDKSGNLRCDYYQSIDRVTHSDHKPVVGYFRLKLKPGIPSGNLCHGKFNQLVYQKGCENRANRNTFGVLSKRIDSVGKIEQSSMCVIA